MKKIYTAQQLADYINCDISLIGYYTKKGMPYRLEYINNRYISRKVKVFDLDVAIKWINENAGVRGKRKVKELVR